MLQNNSSSGATNVDPTSGANTDDYKTLVDKLEREKRGMYEEMKSEREKRQALEERFARLEAERNGATTNHNDEAVQWFTGFAAKPREVLKREFDEMAKPLVDTNRNLFNVLQQREAMDWLAEQEGVTASKVKNSGLMKELSEIAREHNLLGMPVIEGTIAAYKLRLLKKHDEQEAEKNRSATIQNQSTEQPGQTQTQSTGRVWRLSEIANIPTHEYPKFQSDINMARLEGRIVDDTQK